LILDPVMKWTPATQAGAYFVDVATDAKFNNIVAGGLSGGADTSAPDTSLPVGDLLPHTQYFWRVQAVNGCGLGPESMTFSFHTLGPVRLGNNTEDITFVPSGPLANTIAILDGDQVLGMTLDQRAGKSKVRELFRTQGFGGNGITYLASEDHFAVSAQDLGPFLAIFDTSGNFVEMRFTEYASGLFFATEGLAYLPQSAPSFGGDIVVAANLAADTRCSTGPGASLQVIAPDGHGITSILPPEPLACQYIAGVAYQAPDHLLVTVGSDIWTVDFSGEVVSGPVAVPGTADLEGIVQLPSGQVVTADYAVGKLLFFDKDLAPQQPKNSTVGDYRIGIGLSGLYGIAWDSDKHDYVVTPQLTRSNVGAQAPRFFLLTALSPALNSSTVIADPSASGLTLPLSVTYLPNEQSIVVADYGSQVLGVFDHSGVLHDEIDLSSLGFTAALEYLPRARQFAVQGQSTGALALISRAGQQVGSIPLTGVVGTGTAGAFFAPTDASGGRLLLLNSSRALAGLNVVDLNGQLLDSYPAFNIGNLLGLPDAPLDMAAITSGANAGAFVAVDFRSSSIVVFRLE
jgi:uncharacterized protein YjiK